MAQPKNAMEIFRLLDRSNCRACGEKTCLAFAGAVYQGRKALGDCPRLGRDAVNRFGGAPDGAACLADEGQEYLEGLRARIASVDLAAAADRVGGRYADGRLTVKVLGKDFGVDRSGRLFADIHVNPWVAVPFLNHVLEGKGLEPTGDWVSFRELKEGKERYPLFQKRCEAAMKAVADRYPDLFDDMVHLFNGRQVDAAFAADVSVVLHPLPKIPVMICHWQADGRLASTLNVFFDRTADANLDIGSIFSLGAGLTQMFEKLALRHGFQDPHRQRSTH